MVVTSFMLIITYLIKIRHVSDDHVPSLSSNSGHWKVGTVHRARVVAFQAVDGILQLSLQQSILEQKFLQVADVEVGELLKVTSNSSVVGTCLLTL
jgi:rRNA biogenesis protein RRP5